MTPSVRAAGRCGTTRPYLHIQRNAHGKPIGHPDHASFFAAAVENDLAAFVHALHSGADRVIGPPLLQALIAFPNETGFAVASMITGGLLEKFPGLWIGCSHGGGSFGLALPRLQSGWKTRRGENAFLPRPPIEYAPRAYLRRAGLRRPGAAPRRR